MFGLGTGTIEISIPKTSYQAGEEISGTLQLDVKKPVKARGLFIKLYAEQNVREMRRVGSGKLQPVDTVRSLYEFQLDLDKEREYQKTGAPVLYPFRITVPAGAPSAHQQEKPSAGLDLLVGTLQLVSGAGPLGSVKWFLLGYLDLPLAIDVSRKIQLDI